MLNGQFSSAVIIHSRTNHHRLSKSRCDPRRKRIREREETFKWSSWETFFFFVRGNVLFVCVCLCACVSRSARVWLRPLVTRSSHRINENSTRKNQQEEEVRIAVKWTNWVQVQTVSPFREQWLTTEDQFGACLLVRRGVLNAIIVETVVTITDFIFHSEIYFYFYFSKSNF